MFTGLIEEKGIIKSVGQGRSSAEISVSAKKVFDDLKTGDSISVNGVCLTVTSLTDRLFTVDVMAETMRRTNLADLSPGSQVNLERALRIGDRLGGHIVSGHIDGTGIIENFKREDIATVVTIIAEPKVLRYIVSKGSVAVDGISLTVTEVTGSYFKVGIIPHTSGETTLLTKQPGEKVNIECDMIGKYVEKLINKDEQKPVKTKIDESFLEEHGFLL
jgi:riboflavin synthase